MRIIVVGGGIAGVSCVRRLLEGQNEIEVILVSASKHVKTVTNWIRVGQFTEHFDVKGDEISITDPRFTFIHAAVIGWDSTSKSLNLDNGEIISYDKLCLASGASSKQKWNHPKVITLRDTHTALDFQEALRNSKRVGIVGNGGIATELVYELKDSEVIWMIRDDAISSTFFDPAVAKFLETRMQKGRTEGRKEGSILRREKYGVSGDSERKNTGCALGPDWSTAISLEGKAQTRSVKLLRNVTVENVTFPENFVQVSLSNGDTVDCDLLVWAVGVVPNSQFWKDNCPELRLCSDNGIEVDEQMRTNIADVYACGDICTVNWPNQSDSWRQMRLWTQARQMGNYCATSMMSEKPTQLDFCFELFAHVTNFYDYKVVFIGDFKAERQPEGWYPMERIIGEDEYVRCVMYNHRVVGAILVGETNLEETIENLILNRTDMERIEDNFLDPAIDIEDYFD